MNQTNKLHHELKMLATHLPAWAARLVRWLHEDSSRWARILVALGLIAGGVVGFLPVLGFWMVPLGLAILALDVPFLQPPLGKLLGWLNRTLAQRDA